VLFSGDGYMIRQGNKDVLEAMRIRNLFRINTKSRKRPMLYSDVLSHSTSILLGSLPMPAKAPSLLPMGAQNLTLWHQRLGHLNYHDLHCLLNISKGIPIPDSQKSLIWECTLPAIWENITRYIGDEHRIPRADSPLALV